LSNRVAAEIMSAERNTSAPTTMLGLEKEVHLPLIEKRVLNHDTRIFRFGLNSGHRVGLPVGQHISARATINGKMVQRSYTPISSDENLGYVDLLIKVYFPNERFPDGGAMTQHFESLKIGEKLAFIGPKGRNKYLGNGNFIAHTLDGTKDNHVSGINHVVMIAGGSGITPMYHVAKDMLKNDSANTKITILFANKTESDILLRNELEEMAHANPERVNVHFTIDNKTDGWLHFDGHINEDMMRSCFPPQGSDVMVLICGPPGMIKFACLPNLEKLGFEQNRIFVY